MAMALIMFIMAILSQAFVSATNTFRNLKAVGDMANKLRAVTAMMQHDLAADHFEGTKRLSNPNFWVNGPPQQGFFRVWHGSPPSAVPGSSSVLEGTDIDGISSFLSVDHTISFTVKLRGNQQGDFFTSGPSGSGQLLGSITVSVPWKRRYQTSTSTYNYQWAEVTWFLLPQSDPNTNFQDTAGAGGPPLWTLCRNQRLCVPDNSLVPPQSIAFSVPAGI